MIKNGNSYLKYSSGLYKWVVKILILISYLKLKIQIHILTHLSLASHKRGIGKQYRPRSDAAECSVWSGSTLIALNPGISIKHGNNKNNQTPLI